MIKDIPQIGVGTWEVRGQKTVDAVIKSALNSGYTHIDTANIYLNEIQIGKTLKKINADRSKYFITSKIIPLDFKGNRPIKAVKNSLKKLQIDQIDLMLLHMPFVKKPSLRINGYKKLMKAREQGLIRHVGVSNFSIEHLKEIKKETGEYPYVNQIVLAPTVRRKELEDFCNKNKIKLTGYSILRAYFNPNPFYPGSGMNDNQKDYIKKLAKKYKKNVGQILSNWALGEGYTIIPKSVNPDRVKSNLDVANFKLTNIERKEINSWNTLDDDKIMERLAKGVNPLTMAILGIMWRFRIIK